MRALINTMLELLRNVGSDRWAPLALALCAVGVRAVQGVVGRQVEEPEAWYRIG